ncbi:MAG: diadenylate cyclase [Patescibacteria group bacterium]|jgi:diadenylate cyclase
MAEEKKMVDYLRKVSPGNPIRIVIDDLVRSNLGGLILVETPEVYSEQLFEGGFKINCEFTSQKLFELCKMDGGIVISSDFSKILYANVLVTPDKSITTTETGTRHKAAERCAKQANTFVIAVSERRKKTTIYVGNSRYYLKSSDALMRDIGANMQVLEEQRSAFIQLINKLDILEISDMVSAIDVSRILQKAELMSRISEDVKRQIVEIGNEGKIINMRFKELTRNFEHIANEIIRDYSMYSLKKTKTLLQNQSFDDILDSKSISELILERGPDEEIMPRGYRLLDRLDLDSKEASDLVVEFGNLQSILDVRSDALEPLFGERASSVKDMIANLSEQVLSGKSSV